MADEQITDADRRKFREENADRVVSTKNDHVTVYPMGGPSERQREMEALKQDLDSEGSGEPNPYDFLSDDELLAKMKEAGLG